MLPWIKVIASVIRKYYVIKCAEKREGILAANKYRINDIPVYKYHHYCEYLRAHPSHLLPYYRFSFPVHFYILYKNLSLPSSLTEM
jgi:hypothetical protein